MQNSHYDFHCWGRTRLFFVFSWGGGGGGEGIIILIELRRTSVYAKGAITNF